MWLLRGNCTGKKNDIEETNKKGMRERLEDGEWGREVKLSRSILKLRKSDGFVILGGIIL